MPKQYFRRGDAARLSGSVIRHVGFRFCLLWLCAFLSRLIPHAANFSPALAMLVLVHDAPWVALQSRRIVHVLVASLLAVSLTILPDMILAHMSGFPAFGHWQYFTVSAYLLLYGLGAYLHRSPVLAGAFISLCFWLWSNLGVFWFSGLYVHTPAGFLSCYVLALPFLVNSLVATVGWLILIKHVFPNCCELFSILGQNNARRTAVQSVK